MDSKSILYIELDCILDTRVATLASMDLDKTIRTIDRDYYVRERDVFKGFDTNTFKEKYNSRDKSILIHATHTPMVKYIRDYAFAILSANSGMPFSVEPSVVVNIHPYNLSVSEIDAFLRGLSIATKELCEITIVNKPIEEVTPTYLKSEISTAVMYDPIAWIEYHSVNKNLEKVTIPDVTLHGPRVLKEENPSEIDKELFTKEEHDVFSALEYLASPLVSLKLLPIEYFSLRAKFYDPP